MRLEIKALQRDLGVTSLYVTHDQVEAMTLADRMIVMNSGVADQIGKPLDVYADPATEFVAGFIGSPPTNFLDAGQLGRRVEGGAKVGIRPEHIRIVPQTETDFAGKVVYSEPLGAETLVHLKLLDGEDVTVRQEGALPIPEEGESCGLSWEAKDEMIFSEDGSRVRQSGS